MIIKVHIQPGAKRDEVVGMYGDAVKIRLKASPIEGRANEALIKFLSERLHIPRSSINIKHGLASRDKTISTDMDVDIELLLKGGDQ